MIYHYIIVPLQLLDQTFQNGTIYLLFLNFPTMNAPYSESSEQLDHFFPTSLYIVTFPLFKSHLNVQYTDWDRLFIIICVSYVINTWQIKERKNNGEEMLCSSRGSYRLISWQNLYSHHIKLLFNISHVRILGSTEFGKTIKGRLNDNVF